MDEGMSRRVGSGSHRPGGHRKRGVMLAASVAVLLLGMGFGAFGAYAYATTTSVTPGCATRPFATSTPADFSVWRDRTRQALDTTPYRFADYQDVAFPARGADVTIRAWYSPSHRGPSTPTVILVHGKDSCRRDGNVLLPAGMLHRAGFGVLLVDLRNHGESDVTTGHWAAGSTEYADVLGAWDWLVSRGQPPARIGLFGASMGAASATIATAEEPRVAATWADSSFADAELLLGENAAARGFPMAAAIPMTIVGRTISDPGFATRDPADAVRQLAGRPFFIVQGLADATVLPHHAQDLAAAAADGGTQVEPWMVPDAGHTEAMIEQTGRYDARLVAFFSDALGKP